MSITVKSFKKIQEYIGKLNKILILTFCFLPVIVSTQKVYSSSYLSDL